MASQDILSSYINKILSLQEQSPEVGLSEQKLKEVAEELGMDGQDWERVKEYASHHKKKGEGFMRYHNWGKAIEAFHQALPLMPFDERLLQKIAECYYRRWMADSGYSDRRMAVEYAERCLHTNPQNDMALRIITELPSPKSPKQRPNYSEHPAAGSPGKKTAKFAALAGGLLVMGLGLLFWGLSGEKMPRELSVVKHQVGSPLGPGQRDIPISFIGNPNVGEVELLLQESRFQEYSKSSSFRLNGYIRATGAELTRLRLRLSLLDKEGKQLYRSNIDVVKDFDEPRRSQDLIPIAYFEHIRKKGVYPHSARLSITRIDWQNISESYGSAREKKVLKLGNARNAELLLLERGSSFNEHPKDRYVFHKLNLALHNPEGAQPVKALTGTVKWIGKEGKTLLEEELVWVKEDGPQLLPGQSLPIFIGKKVRKASDPSDIVRYQVSFDQIMYGRL